MAGRYRESVGRNGDAMRIKMGHVLIVAAIVAAYFLFIKPNGGMGKMFGAA